MRMSHPWTLQADGAEALFGLSLALFLVVMLIALAILVLSIVVVVQAYKAGREGWWVYLIALFVSPLNLVAIILWFAVWRKQPLMVNGKPFL